MLQVAQNKQKIKELGIKTLADGLNINNVKEKFQADDEQEFDRAYVPGHDSLSEAEEEEDNEIVAKEVARKKQLLKTKEKKAKNVTNPAGRPITRSRVAAPSPMQVQVY